MAAADRVAAGTTRHPVAPPTTATSTANASADAAAAAAAQAAIGESSRRCDAALARLWRDLEAVTRTIEVQREEVGRKSKQARSVKMAGIKELEKARKALTARLKTLVKVAAAAKEAAQSARFDMQQASAAASRVRASGSVRADAASATAAATAAAAADAKAASASSAHEAELRTVTDSLEQLEHKLDMAWLDYHFPPVR